MTIGEGLLIEKMLTKSLLYMAYFNAAPLALEIAADGILPLNLEHWQIWYPTIHTMVTCHHLGYYNCDFRFFPSTGIEKYDAMDLHFGNYTCDFFFSKALKKCVSFGRIVIENLTGFVRFYVVWASFMLLVFQTFKIKTFQGFS